MEHLLRLERDVARLRRFLVVVAVAAIGASTAAVVIALRDPDRIVIGSVTIAEDGIVITQGDERGVVIGSGFVRVGDANGTTAILPHEVLVGAEQSRFRIFAFDDGAGFDARHRGHNALLGNSTAGLAISRTHVKLSLDTPMGEPAELASQTPTP